MFYTVITQPGGNLSEPRTITRPTPAVEKPGLDVSAFAVSDMYQLLRSRVDCLQAGGDATHPIVQTLDDIRDAYVAQVGVGPYFKQMVAATTQVLTAKAMRTIAVRRLSAEAEPESEVDFSDTEAVQRMLKARAYCVKRGLQVNQHLFAAFEQAHAAYLRTVGAPRYLAQMLGELAEVPAAQCRFFLANRSQDQVDFAGDERQPVPCFLQKYFRRRPFYLQVVCQVAGRVQVRYL